jgi:hypothetical protein
MRGSLALSDEEPFVREHAAWPSREAESAFAMPKSVTTAASPERRMFSA